MSKEVERTFNPNLKIVVKPSPFPRFFGRPEETARFLKRNRAWNRWDATRRENPIIEDKDATGFEGYFVGVDNLQPEEVAVKIAEIGVNALRSFKRLHTSDPSYLRKVWQVARGEKFDLEILAELNACLLENTARLRVQVLPQVNPAGAEFRSKIEKMVQGEKIYYHGDQTITEHAIAVPKENSTAQAHAISVNEGTFTKDELREGYEFMKLLGKAGYPLVQEAIEGG